MTPMKPGHSTPAPDDVCTKCEQPYKDHSLASQLCPSEFGHFTPAPGVAATTGGSEVKHTEGPWRFDKIEYATDTEAAGVYEIHTTDLNHWIAVVKTVHGGEEAANAELIARAPETAYELQVVKAAKEKSDAQLFAVVGELAALKALAGKVGPAYSQLQFFQDGYRNGSASISEVMAAGDDFHKTLYELRAALADKGGLNQ